MNLEPHCREEDSPVFPTLCLSFSSTINCTLNHFTGRRNARFSPLSQSLVLLKYQMKRREPRRDWTAIGTKRCSAERRRVSIFVHLKAIGVYSCFRERRNDLGWSSREYKPRALLWPLFAWSEWAHSSTVVAGTTGEGAALASVRSVGVSS
jgi:hypothetical protein